MALYVGFQGELNNGTLCRFSRRAKQWHFVYSCMLGSKPWTPVAVPFSYSRLSFPRQVVESRVESVLWQENGRGEGILLSR